MRLSKIKKYLKPIITLIVKAKNKKITPLIIVGMGILTSAYIINQEIMYWIFEAFYELIQWILEIIKHPFFISVLTYFIFDAIGRYRRVVGKIDSDLLFYKNIINSGASITTSETFTKRKLECSHRLRKLAGDLGAAYNALFIKKFLSLIKQVPCEKDIQNAVKKLGSLSNKIFDSDTEERKEDAMKDIRQILKIPQMWS